MKSKASVSIIGVLIAILSVAFLVQATSIPVIVTPGNLVLRDAYGNIVATSLTVALINNTNGYVQLARALTESGTTFPTVPAVGYLYYRTDLQSLYIWTGLQWVTCMTGTIPPGTISYNDLANLPDLTVYLLKSGARPLTADWNTGAFGIYGLTYLNATAIWVTDLHATNVYANTVYLGNLLVDPVAPAKGQMWYNSAEDTLKYYNGTAIVIVPGIGGGSSTSYTLPYSYTIYKTGSTYYMQKYDGTIWSSTNASAIREAALGNITAGTILYKSGTYTFTTKLTGKNFVQEYGEGNETVFQPADATVSPLFDFGTLASGIMLQHVRLSNLKIEMNFYTNSIAISLKNVKDSEFDHIYIHNYYTAFKVEGYDGTYYSFWNKFHDNFGDNWATNATRTFYLIGNMGWDSWITSSYCHSDGGYGVKMEYNATGWNIDGCWFEDCVNAINIQANSGIIDGVHVRTCWLDRPTQDAIYIDVSTGWGFLNSEFSHNHFVNVPASYNNFFFVGNGGYVTRVNIESNYDGYTTKAYIVNKTGTFSSFANVNFYDNQMRTGASGTYNGINFAYNNIRGDIACITEKSGSATIMALSMTVTVTHGCSGTVDYVRLTPTSDLGGRTYWVSSKDATSFVITISSADLDNNLSFDWEAQYIP